jgi:hypothetical protein
VETYEANEQVHVDCRGHQYRMQRIMKNPIQVESECPDDNGSSAAFGTCIYSTWARSYAAPLSAALSRK